METNDSRSPPVARDAIVDDAWNWRDDDWSSYLRVKNRVAQALSCYGEVPDEMLEESKEPSEEDLRIADLAAVTPAAHRGGSFEDSDDETPDGTADTLEARARLFTPACKALPKVELHAHLNGCVRDQTLLELARLKGDAEGVVGASTTLASLRDTLKGAHGGDGASSGASQKRLKKCFELFAAIHAVCTDHVSIARVAAEAVVDFALDGVVYLELRTTPKDLPSAGVTKESYCEAALRGMALGAHVARRALRRKRGEDVVFVARLILSIDRKESIVEAKRTVRLAAYLRDTDCGVVGVDLSGDPSVGSFAKLEPAMKLARKNGLPVTLHCGEVVTRGEEAAMLRFKPERLGHCISTTRDEALWEKLQASKIPIELCITSNVVTDSVEKETRSKTPSSDTSDAIDSSNARSAPSTPSGPSDGAGLNAHTVPMSVSSAAARHHLAKVHRAGHPFTIATDDPGVFDTTLSREYALAASCCGLGSEDLRQIARNSFEYAFVHAHEAMNEDDEESVKGDIERVRAFLARETRAWPGLPAVTAADAIRESATKATSATKRRIAGVTREVTRRVELFKNIAADLADVVSENENLDDDEERRVAGDERARETRRSGARADIVPRALSERGDDAPEDVDCKTSPLWRTSNNSESISKWSKVRAIVGGAEGAFDDDVNSNDENYVPSGSGSISSSKAPRLSKRGACLEIVRVLLKPGSGDRADVAMKKFVSRVAPLFAPGAGDLRDDIRTAKRVLVELGLLDESEKDARDDKREAYEALLREAEENDESQTSALAALRRVGLFRVRRAARLRRRRARRRLVLQTRAALLQNGPLCAFFICAAFGNWPFTSRLSDGGDASYGKPLLTRLFTSHALALFRSAKASFAFLMRDGAGGTLPTYDSVTALFKTHVKCVGAFTNAFGTFAATGLNGVFPTPETASTLVTKHAKLLSRAVKSVFLAAFGSGSEHAPSDFSKRGSGVENARESEGIRRVFVVPKQTERGASNWSGSGAASSSSSSRGDAASSAPRSGAFSGVSERFVSGGGPRRPRHVELVASSRDPSPGSGDLLRWDRETPEQE